MWAGQLALLAALSGCGSVPASINPVTWWHDLQGGVIAEQRPPPPGATDPYPNLASIPPRPTPLDPAIRESINQGLVADRANAEHAAAAAPIPDPSSRIASPALFGGASSPASPPPIPPPAADAAPRTSPGLSASFAAATAPPPLPGAARPAAPAGRGVLGPQPEGSTAQMGAPPPLPTAPPAPADLPGANPPPPPSVKPPPPPPAAAPLPPGSVPGSVIVPFAPASAALSPAGSAAVHAIAVKRDRSGVVVIGYGDAPASDPDTQAAALALAVARAQAIVQALIAEGVPAQALVSDAQAEGRGAAVRLVN